MSIDPNLQKSPYPTATPASPEQIKKSKMPPIETEDLKKHPAMLSITYGGVLGMVYSLYAKVHPLKSTAALSANIYLYKQYEILANDAFPQNPFHASIAKLIVFIAGQYIFKAIYRTLGMFNTGGGHLFFWSTSAALTLYHTCEVFEAYENRPKPPSTPNPDKNHIEEA